MTASLGVAVFNAHRRYRIRSQPIVKYVRRVLMKERRRKADVSIVFVDARSIRRLNREYLGHDFGTDVLSFCLEKKGILEGEVYVSLDSARQQARRYHVAFSNEVARLVIHGTLHLVGYDDGRPQQAKKMKKVEEAHLLHWFS